MGNAWCRRPILGPVLLSLLAVFVACGDGPNPVQVTEDADPRLGVHLFAADGADPLLIWEGADGRRLVALGAVFECRELPRTSSEAMVWRYLDAEGRVAGQGNWVVGQLTCLRQGDRSMAVPFSSDTVVTTDETVEGSCLRFTRPVGHRDGWLFWDEGVTSGEFPAGVILPDPMPAARYASAAACPPP